jgi:hypothetical protein
MRLSVSVVFLLLHYMVALGDISLFVGDHPLAANTPGQQIEIFVGGGDVFAGINFNAQVEDGFPEVPGSVSDGPNITGVDLIGEITPTVLTGNNNGQVDPGSASQVAFRAVTTQANSVAAKGLLVTLTIDTTGIDDGTFSLRLQDTVAGPTTFLDSQATTIPTTIVEGTLSIITKQVITLDCPQEVDFSPSTISLGARSTSGLPVSVSVLSGPASGNQDQLSLNGLGLVEVEVTQGGNDFFEAADPVRCAFQVVPGNVEIQLQRLEQVFDTRPREVFITTNPPGISFDLAYDGNPAAPVDAGNYEVQVMITDPQASHRD